MTNEEIQTAIINFDPNKTTDDADPISVLCQIMYCSDRWEPEARIIGNIRAIDISNSIYEILTMLRYND